LRSPRRQECRRSRHECLRHASLVGAEGFGLYFAFLADQHLDAGFRFFQLFAAGVAEAHALLEELEGALERQIAPFELLDDLFELVETGFEGKGGIGLRGFGHFLILPVLYSPGYAQIRVAVLLLCRDGVGRSAFGHFG